MTDHERLPDPELFATGRMQRALRLAGNRDLRADAAQLARLRQFAQADDPLADDVVAMIHAMPRGEGRALFEQALAEGIDSVDNPPPPLVAFFRDVEATPYWVDFDRIDNGARSIIRTGLLGMFPLGDMSLMGGYLASRAVKTLVHTGDLEHTAARRLAETASWWIDVTTPGALRPQGDGMRAALQIRLVHAFVRDAMNRRDDWDYDAWDRPVNQVQTVGTLLLFSLVFLLGTQLLGIRYTQQEREDVMHLWRYVGWLMGVDDELLPGSEADAWRLLWLLAATEFIPDNDSKRLANALLAQNANIGAGLGPLSGVVGSASVSLHAAISRMLIGGANADFLGLPRNRLTDATVRGIAAVTFAAETARMRVPGATWLQQKIGELTRSQYLAQVSKALPLDRSYSRPMDTPVDGAA
ncbi:oxygenase MpaB family protein [Haloechinothrix salitolerans]|uniref:Oxygenase MpaB family protein n=1 Tax=Haloechinothrix salitolerans TaxID=926830 RepID=A0ABW2BRU7_9PSEU